MALPRICAALGGGLWLAAAAAAAAAPAVPDDDDAAALALPGPAAAAPGGARPLSAMAEAAAIDGSQRSGGDVDGERASLAVRYDTRWSREWRVVLAERLDSERSSAPDGWQTRGTTQQTYLSWQPAAGFLADAGRINARQGVAYGYNPTDLLRADAVRTVVSLDPGSLRDNRWGTVMVRTEALWDGGAVSGAYVPRLAGPTNSKDRWLMSLTERVNSALTPQWLLSDSEGGSPQLGLDLTAAPGNATVVYAEALAGRSPSLWQQALGLPGARSVRARAATGLTYTTAAGLSLTLEYEYDGAALGRGAWDAARRGDLEQYGVYRNFVEAEQELPTQHAAFVYWSWQDVLVRHLDLSGFVRADLADHSRLPWAECRYHWSHADLALQYQQYRGGPLTDYGAAPLRQTWQMLLDYTL